MRVERVGAGGKGGADVVDAGLVPFGGLGATDGLPVEPESCLVVSVEEDGGFGGCGVS